MFLASIGCVGQIQPQQNMKPTLQHEADLSRNYAILFRKFLDSDLFEVVGYLNSGEELRDWLTAMQTESDAWSYILLDEDSLEGCRDADSTYFELSDGELFPISEERALEIL
jgi:hypothetical protein